MAEYEVRPPTVEAYQVPPAGNTMRDRDAWVAVELWCNGKIQMTMKGPSHIEFTPLGYVSDGVMAKAYPGDWIVKGKSTGQWSCSDETFKKTYKEVTN